MSGIPIDEYPLEKCIVPGICIDLRHFVAKAEIGPADLEAAVKKAGVPVPNKALCCCAPVITRVRSRARNMQPTIQA